MNPIPTVPISVLRSLIVSWERQMAELERGIKEDKAKGLIFTSQAQDIGRYAIKGCKESLESVLECYERQEK